MSDHALATATRLLNFHEGMRALDVGAQFGEATKAMTAAEFDSQLDLLRTAIALPRAQRPLP